jgi:ABC-2 type transport system permease protein
MSLRRLVAVAVKELRQVARDRMSIFLVAVMPAVLVALFGYALTLDVDHIPLAIVDRDRSEASRDLIQRFTSGGTFNHTHDAASAAELQELLDAGRVRAGLVIPPRFGGDLAAARGTRVQLLLDGADSNTARIAQGYATVIGRTRGSEVLVEEVARAAGAGTTGATIEARAHVWFNPELRSANFVIPGLLGIVLLVANMMMTAMSVVREKERGTLEALAASPVRPIELILGKTLPYFGFAFLETALAMLVAIYGFGVPFRGSVLVLLAVVALFAIGALGYGLLISTIAPTQQQAWTLGLVTTLLPSFLLSGFVFPIENMLPAVQAVTRVIQARYFIAALRAVILKGVGFDAILPQIAALATFAVVFPGLAALRFRKVS